MKIGIIVLSHGAFAKAALDSAEMIAGHQEQVRALTLTEDKSLEQLQEELHQTYCVMAKENDLIVALCDIYGGTPFNALLRNMLHGDAILAYAGLSLPLLIDLLFSREQVKTIEEVKRHMEETARMVVKEIILPTMEEEEEE